MSFLINLGVGLLFGLGLVISGMVDPAKVKNFLDLFGTWDPSLAFVMAGAILVTFIGYRTLFRRGAAVFGAPFQLPTLTDLDRRIFIGPALFGIGWGLGGVCPGPALTSISLGHTGILVFVPAMFAGMWAARLLTDTDGKLQVQAR
ncbi:MAG TPA: YeeE/YedE family protein [Xanthobacteraceae bacterium]|nr:YeeE/YedE family protein [Xanthobacteraceae bacterium]